MIKKLRLKFILVSMSGVLLVLVIIFATQNYLMIKSSEEQTNRLLESVVMTDGNMDNLLQKPEGGGLFPGKEKKPEGLRPPAQETLRGAKFFFVKFDTAGNVLESDVSHMSGLTAEDAASHAQAALRAGGQSGVEDGYQFLIGQKEYGTIVALAQRDVETSMLRQLTTISAAAVIGGVLVFLVLVLILSKWAVRPVKTAFDKQRQFISNAGHELKTPITIIAANSDVLHREIGDNKWLSYIQNQNERMAALVNDLLTLARTDESGRKPQLERFDLSGACMNCTLEFESIAYESGKAFLTDIQPDIRINGNEPMLKQLLYILVDNALKHSDQNGEVRVSLKSAGSKAVLEVFNTGEGIAPQERDKIFERFFRSDSSRSRETGGYGLGLAIGKSIVELHKGKISVRSEQGKWTQFTVVLPLQ